MSAIATGLLLFLQVPFAPGLEGRDLYQADAEWAAAWVRAGKPRPNLSLVAVPAFEPDEETGEIDVEALWSFFVSPDTPWTRAQAALERLVPDRWHPPLTRGRTGEEATRIRECFVQLLPRFVEALHELRQEAAEHRFGLRGHPHHSNLLLPFIRYEHLKGRERIILGRPWTVPHELVAYPIWWEEHDSAPWPWRVQQIVEELWRIAPPRHDGDYARRWIDACLELPWRTDEEALLFVTASTSGSGGCTLAVVSRWRAIALDPTKPRAADALSGRGWHRSMRDGTDERLLREVMAVDLMTESPHERVRWYASRTLPYLRVAGRSRREESRGPLPAAAVLAAARQACDGVREADDWTRLNVYALGACFAVDDPPVPADRQISIGSPEIGALLDSFCVWFARERHRLEELAAEHAEERAALRARLEELAR